MVYGGIFFPALQANYEACKEVGSPKGQSPHYYNGMWTPKPEGYDPDLKPPGKWLQEATFSWNADHCAWFSVEEVLATEKTCQVICASSVVSLSLTGFWVPLVTAGKYSMPRNFK